MFETFCALLLRIYPAGFRRAYGRDAMQLVRDRARDERGVVLRLRLLGDLAVDLFTASLHGWHPATPVLTQIHGAPRFDIIEAGGPRPQSIAAGTVTSLVLFASFTLLFQPRVLPEAAAPFGDGSGSDAPAAASSDDGPQAGGADIKGTHHTLIAAIASHLRQFYVDRAIGQQLADTLLTFHKNGAYASLGMGADLAARINTDIQTTSRALGIPRGVFVADVVYSAQPLPTGPPPPMTAEVRERIRATLLQQNCLFETIETLPHDIGYVKLNGFADVTVCREAIDRAMASLDDAAALVIDLRDNGGGFGESAVHLAAYLFDRPAYMYDPRPGSPVPASTSSPVPGSTLADTPVYVLTSSTTQSAAEYFVYNLKMLKRATIVGETTAGHQHSGAFHRIDDHFGIGIQEVAPPDNPYPVKGWEVFGIEPDVKVSSAGAPEAAKTLAEQRIRAR